MSRKPRIPFKIGDLVIYPAHGMGRVISVDRQAVYGTSIELISVLVEDEGLTLKIPTDRVNRSGMRRLSDGAEAEKALNLMKGRARTKAGNWNRRAQEYDSKINSGDLLLAAEVVRDLRGKSGSYSERQIYGRALNRVTREIGQVLGRDPDHIRDEVESAPGRSAA